MSESSRQRSLRGSILYFFLFSAYGCIMPFLPLVWRSKGLSEHEVGLLGAIKPLASFFVTPIACSFADMHGIERQMLLAALVAYPVCLSTVLLATTFIGVLLVQTATSVSVCPISSLIDSSVLRSSGTDGYGSQRLWGAVGFGVASLLGGYVSDASSGSFSGAILLFLGFMVITFATSTTLFSAQAEGSSKNPSSNALEVELGARARECITSSVTVSSPVTDTEDSSTFLSEYSEHPERQIPEEDPEIAKDDQTEGVLTAWRIILGSTESATFFAAVGLSGMGMGLIDTFLFIWVEELGGNHLLCGIARMIMCFAEVPFFSLSGALIKRLGVRGMIAMTQAAYLTRFIYYSVLEEPWWVLPAEVLHGLTFAAMWAATTNYAHMIAPENLHSTFQGLVTGIHSGFGVGLGAMVGGILYASLGARKCFCLGAILPSLSLVLLSLPTLRVCRQRRPIPTRASEEPLTGGGEYELVSKGSTNSSTISSNTDDGGEDSQYEEDRERDPQTSIARL